KSPAARRQLVVDDRAAVLRRAIDEQVLRQHGQQALGIEVLRQLAAAGLSRIQITGERIIDDSGKPGAVAGGPDERLDLGDPARLLWLARRREPQVVGVQLTQRETRDQTRRIDARLRNDARLQVLVACRLGRCRRRTTPRDRTEVLGPRPAQPARQDNRRQHDRNRQSSHAGFPYWSWNW